MSRLKKRVQRHFGDSLSPDEAYLSYHDVRLTNGDVDSIKNDWLTDNAIAFWEEYIEREHLSAYPQANIVLLRPSMSFMLMNTPDPLTLKDVLPNFKATTHIFLPVNDNVDPTAAEGGTHWSLIVVSVIDGVAFHYDSLAPSNDREARATTKQLSKLLGKPLRYMAMQDTPQQENGSDCGVYVCLLMRHLLLKRLLRHDSRSKISMSMRDQDVDAKGGRKMMVKIIEERRKEAEKRRSRSTSPFGSRNGSHSGSPPRIGDDTESG
ncbi:ulp1 protease family protein [Westerdykella ornata]|uniref:Ulp1 protease family protein n=1 Tax=Westerdykella ornata TaxID=318751 RepID=A0A6A6K0M1_WESOR|nr:ulp1 protease family protein [Westerdykella ornata]KAF2280879.1 ulp1 protease family protein [Westerdykella ornata]